MNNLDKQYQSLLQDILDNGVEKKDRTGTGTISVFGRQIRHKMSEGEFPLLTTKKMHWKSIVTELLWFLRGETNIKYLVDNDCHIWDGDCYKAYVKKHKHAIRTEDNRSEIVIQMLEEQLIYPKEEFINKIKTDETFANKWGDLGPIYGKQWRSWGREFSLHIGLESDGSQDKINFKKGIDQIANLINELKTNPDSRRLMVSAWNVGELDQMVLPPCHYGFQVYTRELSLEERRKLAKYDSEFVSPMTVESWDRNNIPTRAISLMWNQRSVDSFLGLPFNIASYGLLLEIIAKEVNMVPDELIGNLGDVHLYLNHVEQAKEQIGREMTWEEQVQWVMKNTDVEMENLSIVEEIFKDSTPQYTREPYPLPTLKIEDGFDIVSGLDDIYEINSFTLENYQSHPAIKAPLSN